MTWQDSSKRKRDRKIKRLVTTPVDAVLSVWQNIRELFDLVMSITGLRHRQPRRYNRDFEKAGKEVPRVDDVDSGSLKALKQATKTREQEIIQQVKFERKTLRRKTADAEELRQSMQDDNQSVSRGDSISHLARMNEQARKKKASEKKDQAIAPAAEAKTAESQAEASETQG